MKTSLSFFFGFLLHLFSVLSLSAQGTEDYCKSAAEKFSKGDFSGAVDDATKCLEQGPAEIKDYNDSAKAEHDKGDLESEAADRDRVRLPRFLGQLVRIDFSLGWIQT